MPKWKSVSLNVGETMICGQIRGHKIFGDVPEELGGHDCAVIPPEGILVTLGNCMGMVIALACKARDVPYQGIKLEVTADVNDDENYLDNFRIRITMPEELDEKGRRAVKFGEALCKTANTLRRAAKVEVEVVE